MSTPDTALNAFEAERTRLFAIAYRMLGSATEADDALQEAYLRWAGAHASARSAQAVLTTIVTRLCIDRLTSAQARRETYIGPWLPEPVLTTPDTAAQTIDMNDAISLALLALLERLNPVERAVYVLRAVFDYDYAEIAAFVEKSEDACRQTFSRAQKFVRDNRPRLAPSKAAHETLLMTFLGALASGDVDPILALLHESVVQYGDGGGKAFAAKHPIVGRENVARLLAGLRKLMPAGALPSIEEVNGWPALVIRHADGRAYAVTSIETDGALIYAVRNVINPDKLGLPVLKAR
jgi:RNA polymerase sigma-70 factor, ECF subfamily